MGISQNVPVKFESHLMQLTTNLLSTTHVPPFLHKSDVHLRSFNI